MPSPAPTATEARTSRKQLVQLALVGLVVVLTGVCFYLRLRSPAPWLETIDAIRRGGGPSAKKRRAEIAGGFFGRPEAEFEVAEYDHEVSELFTVTFRRAPWEAGVWHFEFEKAILAGPANFGSADAFGDHWYVLRDKPFEGAVLYVGRPGQTIMALSSYFYRCDPESRSPDLAGPPPAVCERSRSLTLGGPPHPATSAAPVASSSATPVAGSPSAAASPAPSGFQFGPVTGAPADCAALAACCSPGPSPKLVGISCPGVATGRLFPDCKGNLDAMRALWIEGKMKPPAGCLPATPAKAPVAPPPAPAAPEVNPYQ